MCQAIGGLLSYWDESKLSFDSFIPLYDKRTSWGFLILFTFFTFVSHMAPSSVVEASFSFIRLCLCLDGSFWWMDDDIPCPGKLGANVLTSCRIDVYKTNIRDHDLKKTMKKEQHPNSSYVFFDQLV